MASVFKKEGIAWRTAYPSVDRGLMRIVQEAQCFSGAVTALLFTFPVSVGPSFFSREFPSAHFRPEFMQSCFNSFHIETASLCASAVMPNAEL